MDYVRLSKEISYALRHAPWEYELELDENGWVDVQQLLSTLREDRKWEGIGIEDIIRALESSDKKRHEIAEEKIRALYGHSIPQKITKVAEEPPEILYHGNETIWLGDSVDKRYIES